jgi:hypothetical protein
MPRRSKIYFHETFLSLSKCFFFVCKGVMSHFVFAIAARKHLYVFPHAVKLFSQKVAASCCMLCLFLLHSNRCSGHACVYR